MLDFWLEYATIELIKEKSTRHGALVAPCQDGGVLFNNDWVLKFSSSIRSSLKPSN